MQAVPVYCREDGGEGVRSEGMIGRAAWLTQHPSVFRTMTGISVAEYRQLVRELEAPYAEAERRRLA